MTTISSAAGAIAAYTGYYEAQATAGRAAISAAPIASTNPVVGVSASALVQDSNSGAALTALLGTGAGSVSTLSTLLSLAGNSTATTGFLTNVLGGGTAGSDPSSTSTLLGTLTGTPATTAGSRNPGLSLLDAVTGQTGAAGTDAAPSTRQQTIVNALAGAYAQNRQNLFTLLA